MSTLDNIVLNGTTYDLGGTGGGTIPAENIKETVYSEEVNILPALEWTEGIYINSNGEAGENALWVSSDYYPVGSEVNVTICYSRAGYVHRFHCYNDSKTWIGMVDAGGSTANVPMTMVTLENTAYIRFSVPKGQHTSDDWLYVNVPTTYTVRDWQDTILNRMNQLAVREDIYSRLDGIVALLWNYKKWNGKYIVADGNSLVQSSNWLRHTCDFLGAIPVNLGKSGSAITRPDQPSAGATIAQKQDYIKSNVANNYPAKADLIILQESSYLDGDYSDQMDGAEPKATWTARMNYLIRCLKTKYPNVLIVLIPDPTWYTAGSGSAGNDSTLNTTIADSIFNSRNAEALRVMRGLAEYNRLAFFDVDHSTPFNPLQKTNYYSQYYWLHEQYPAIGQDGVHPYTPYNVAKGKALAHFIAGLIFDPEAPNDAVEGWENLVYTINSDGSCTYPNIGVPE